MVSQEVIMIYYDSLLEELDDAKRATYFGSMSSSVGGTKNE